MKKCCVVLMLVIVSFAYANTKVYVDSVKPLYLTQDSQKIVGKLLPTSEVTIIKKVGNKVLLSLQGYIQEGSDNALYFVMGKRILIAGLTKNSGIKFNVLGTQKDKDTQTTYQKVSLELWSDEGGLSGNLDDLYTKAKDLYSQNCSICHSLHASTEFKANQWPSVIKSMSGRTGLNKDEIYLITQYLQKHASDVK
ncbi:hypothetical protein [Helicobacter sp. 11S03491-1]|uniref:hypothetical protein n=1 Tax=Helicobacter sp. 11S03491-1 TaxID=1476196 RepID=UPI000BA6AD3A|nr:hypothetical protein [Helicobacter sp. 11S03491-1]PAF41084.1 hypothetical protein BKH45_08390 [Helicobacter sp. 11S03491-1]